MVVPMMCYRALVGSAVTDVQQPAAEPAANQATTSTSPAAEEDSKPPVMEPSVNAGIPLFVIFKDNYQLVFFSQLFDFSFSISLVD